MANFICKYILLVYFFHADFLSAFSSTTCSWNVSLRWSGYQKNKLVWYRILKLENSKLCAAIGWLRSVWQQTLSFSFLQYVRDLITGFLERCEPKKPTLQRLWILSRRERFKIYQHNILRCADWFGGLIYSMRVLMTAFLHGPEGNLKAIWGHSKHCCCFEIAINVLFSISLSYKWGGRSIKKIIIRRKRNISGKKKNSSDCYFASKSLSIQKLFSQKRGYEAAWFRCQSHLNMHMKRIKIGNTQKTRVGNESGS